MLGNVLNRVYSWPTRLGESLSRVPIILWIAVYLATLIAYAIVFRLSSATFYHTTIKHERSYWRQSRALALDLQNAIYESIDDAYDHHVIRKGGWQIARDDLRVDSVQEVEGNIVLSLSVHALNELYAAHDKDTSNFLQYFHKAEARLSNEIIKYGENIYIPVDLLNNRDPFDIIPDFNSLDLNSVFRQKQLSIPAIRIDESLFKKMGFFLDASAGFPYGIRNHFFRMLYLSAVTITTLGYGDIVPLDGLARFLVGTEATIGILLLGLILNSATNVVRVRTAANTVGNEKREEQKRE